VEYLSERLEIRLNPDTLRMLREEAQLRDVPVAQLVRQAIDNFLEEDRQLQFQAAQALFQVEAPVADWGQMKQEIEEALGDSNSA
jgi:hypothetical protein